MEKSVKRSSRTICTLSLAFDSFPTVQHWCHRDLRNQVPHFLGVRNTTCMPFSGRLVASSEVMNVTYGFRQERDMNLEAERDLISVDLQVSTQSKTLRHRRWEGVFTTRVSPLVATIFMAIFLSTSAVAQEQQRAYNEYTYWFSGAFENGHAFSSTIGARNYQLESRYERLLYSGQRFNVRWVFDAVPVALVGDRYTSTGRRAYSYGVGGSPIGAQVNFVHYRHIQLYCSVRWWCAVVYLQSPYCDRSGIQVSPHFERESCKSKPRIGLAYVVHRSVRVSVRTRMARSISRSRDHDRS